MEDHRKELQLLPPPPPPPPYSPWPSPDLIAFRSHDVVETPLEAPPPPPPPSLDLQLSITSLSRPVKHPAAAKWRASDQIAAMEKAYVERVAEMTRREMEMAQSEFARARHMWERAREEVVRVERMKERATRQMGSCMEITCQGCRKKFRR